MKKSTFATLAIFVVFVVISIFLIAYARGYRFDFKNKKIQTTGLLVATSIPDGASVYINNHLTTATNATINLTPDDYIVRIIKEGYLPWQKNLKIQQEVVTKTDTTLFPSTPELKPLTVNGALNPSLSPDGTKIVFSVDGNDFEKAGLYILDMFDRPLSFSRSVREIAKSNSPYDYAKAKIVWSPDSKSLIAYFENELLDVKNSNNENEILGVNPDNVDTALLIQTDSESPPKDITPTLSITLQSWQEDLQSKYQDQLVSLPIGFVSIATTSASPMRFSPDETKVMYEATASGTLPKNIKPALVGSNSQPEERTLIKGKSYVYDVKEDKNFALPDSSLTWFPDSKHFVYVEKDKISLLDYDNTNKVTVYAGPFEDSYVFPWSNGSKFVILTTLNRASSENANLYSLGLK